MKVIYLILFLFFFKSFAQVNECSIYISNKKIDLCKEYNKNSIIKAFGIPIKIKKEKSLGGEGDEEPWSTYLYNGLEVTLIGNYINEIIISNNKWSINNINLKTPIEKINKKFIFYKKEKGLLCYRLNKISDIIIYVKYNSKGIVEIGINSQ